LSPLNLKVFHWKHIFIAFPGIKFKRYAQYLLLYIAHCSSGCCFGSYAWFI